MDPEGMPEWAPQVASFDRATVERHRRLVHGREIRVQSTPVRTMTFDTLLTETGVGQVDVLQIDTEGYDLEILRLFDVPRRRPRVVNWEHTHLSRRDREAAVTLMMRNGFAVAMSGFVFGDSVAYRL
jgi:hypothetical protein